jgi:hypothetical protein
MIVVGMFATVWSVANICSDFYLLATGWYRRFTAAEGSAPLSSSSRMGARPQGC